MKRLIILCEGPTEQEFCAEVLAPSFIKSDIIIENPTVKKTDGGIASWQSIRKQLISHLNEGDAHVSMLIDYYGIRNSLGFPGWEESKAIQSKVDRMHFLFNKLSNDIPNHLRCRFHPYIQLHEFEGLLFSDVDAFLRYFKVDEMDLAALKTATQEFANPELINNSPSTAPSKRLIDAIIGYDKVLYGNCIALEIGLKKMREKCPLFNEWLSELEKIF